MDTPTVTANPGFHKTQQSATRYLFSEKPVIVTL